MVIGGSVSFVLTKPLRKLFPLSIALDLLDAFALILINKQNFYIGTQISEFLLDMYIYIIYLDGSIISPSKRFLHLLPI